MGLCDNVRRIEGDLRYSDKNMKTLITTWEIESEEIQHL